MKSANSIVLLLALCATTTVYAVPPLAHATDTGPYLQNGYYSDWCVTDRGEGATAALQACTFDTNGAITSNQR
ncbi:hypothetical protein ACIP5Y_24955 [Nocardia sp. NPDC088792]|uniref:hypothetical protein n=1 Tax=Nocardia sp. NPDC088792 TaxID=3364332 RepID=UPI0037F4EC47